MNMWKDKNVLVPGGTGLIGAPLVKRLLKLGANVHVVSLDDPSRCPEGARFQQLNLTDFDSCMEACKGMDFIFDMLGTKASPDTARNRPASHFVTNMQLQLPFLEAARIQKVPGLLFASSIGVYGNSEIMHEDDVWQTFPSPNDWFGGWAKRMGELQIEGYRKEYGMDRLTIVRPANVYGPGDCFEGDHAMVVPSLIRRAIEASETGADLVVWGDGSPERDFIFSDDVARMCIEVAEANPQDPINIGNGSATSIRRLVEIIKECVDPGLNIVWDTDKPKGDRLRRLDVERAASYGIQANISLEEGVRQTVEWYMENRHQQGDKHNAYADR
ncbi:NAD-dependent epimerase/dehydratase family protein [Pseudodesulfovibrio sp. zrk46]|uniref:NAD-dependent epimerase/dehydratase family protein n=1 Tax=Pseudodesulfovibrio sp. zrk46 TaxID=2725288 RepID=UPI001448E4CB|nr:NAD-dependent epimerase/dehydratase family protein [Pseudodesulfovibrio sp. zrk46]QJB55721.1 NAD-dependent epimerase/dehydratase family protein [Pseudodesulfovibrio sp. zrk46]